MRQSTANKLNHSDAVISFGDTPKKEKKTQ